MLNRPPPYFPQNQLSPPDENRYKKFKLVVAGLVIGSALLLAAIGLGIYYLIDWLF
jgi:F0F1-type ATP synthase membrane subunit c/vacuolar-type H+-ATPase subunit K